MKCNPTSGLAKRIALLAIPVLAVLLALPGSSYAQRMTGDLSGSVVDESGGVIPGADVSVTNENSGAVRRTVTNSDGFFAFASLPAATYTLKVSITGFNTYEVKGIELRSGDSRSLRQVSLKVATMSETVSVSAEVALTPLNSGEKSATLTGDQIENIPIVGTSAAEVLRLLPGMTPSTNGTSNKPNFSGEIYGINGNGEGGQQSAVGNYSANGNRTWALDITIDGAPGADPGCNCATSVNPNTEFVQEFKVLQANFSAEHAKGPVAMSVVSKQGGREFHGSLFGYLRDYHLNSNEWFGNKVGAERVKNKFIYPGFTISGPLLIPGTGFNKNRDKVFFFAGFEYFGQKLDTGYVKSWVPTAEMKNGDFRNAAAVGSGSFVNTVPTPSVIPQNQWDPGGRALLNLFPSPNANPATTGGYNYIDNLLIDQNGWQGLARLDFNVSDSTKLFIRYNVQRETQPFVIGLWWRNGERQLPYPSQISGKNRSDSVSASLTHVFDPTLTNETIFAVTYINFPNVIDDRQAVSRQALGYPYQGVFGDSNDQIPSVDPGGWGANGPFIFNPGGFDPILFAKKWQVSAQDNLTKVWGLHTLKIGGYYEYVSNAQPNNANSNGLVELATWEGGSTGNTFADLLRGGPINYGESSKNTVNDMHYNLFEGYIQDSWKVKPRLTLDYGIRLSYFGPWTDNSGGGMAAWDPATYSSELAAGTVYPGIQYTKKSSGWPLSGVDGSWFYVTPRVGFAWDTRGTGETVVRGGFGMYRYHEPQSIYSGLLTLGAGMRSYSTDGVYLSQLEGLGGGALPGAGNAIDVTDNKQPLSYTWSLTLNQKLPWSMNVELGYVGNKNKYLLNNGIANVNAVPIGAMLSNPDGNQDLYRPYSAYGDLNVYRHNMYSNYHSMQALLSRQRGNFNFTASYTFSKSLGVRTNEVGTTWGSEYIVPVDQYYYGVQGSDRTHVASVSFSWLLGEFKNNAALNAFLGGWQLAGVGTYVSGPPLQAASNVNFNMQGTNAQGVTIDGRHIAGSPMMAAFPVLTCDPTKDVPSGYMFNTSCFSAPSVGQNGNYVWPYIRGNSYKNLDLSLFKNFSVGSKGQKIQLRISGYNVLNHPTWYPDSGQNLTLNFTNGVQSNSGFGKINEDNKFGRRIVQLALRFTF
ncbi:MAG: carboxypeptidase-like regulatory domain-containing protein [Vicinamibacteria bacterium]